MSKFLVIERTVTITMKKSLEDFYPGMSSDEAIASENAEDLMQKVGEFVEALEFSTMKDITLSDKINVVEE